VRRNRICSIKTLELDIGVAHVVGKLCPFSLNKKKKEKRRRRGFKLKPGTIALMIYPLNQNKN
jgi:hypothetical protein